MKPTGLRFAAISALIVLGAMSATAPARAQSAPFAGFSGVWSGAGTILMADGSSERLKCRATYQVSSADSALSQLLRCASDSYRFDLRSDVVSEGGRVSGSWSEASRGVSGDVQGRVSGGNISAIVDAPGFTANLALATHGNRQSVKITSQGEIREIMVAMKKN
jgi:hypothetical protein